jgi:hypothetical protein
MQGRQKNTVELWQNLIDPRPHPLRRLATCAEKAPVAGRVTAPVAFESKPLFGDEPMTSTKNRVSFKVNISDRDIIARLVMRAENFYKMQGVTIDRTSLLMDLTATHANGCSLKLQAMLNADDSNFLHDICGISQHLDRSTGQLKNCFSPRFSA